MINTILGYITTTLLIILVAVITIFLFSALIDWALAVFKKNRRSKK
jgi:phosphate starvation-inducible membrane PsiE